MLAAQNTSTVREKPPFLSKRTLLARPLSLAPGCGAANARRMYVVYDVMRDELVASQVAPAVYGMDRVYLSAPAESDLVTSSRAGGIPRI